MGVPSASTTHFFTSPCQKPCSSMFVPTSTLRKSSGPSSMDSSTNSSGLITQLNPSMNSLSSFSRDRTFFSSVGGDSTAVVLASHLFWTDSQKSSMRFFISSVCFSKLVTLWTVVADVGFPIVEESNSSSVSPLGEKHQAICPTWEHRAQRLIGTGQNHKNQSPSILRCQECLQ